MPARTGILLAFLLAACGQDVRALPLAEVDLSNMTEVQRLGQELSPTDRVAFTTYVALHGRSSGHCGRKLAGPAPQTIGEAIQLMRSTANRPA